MGAAYATCYPAEVESQICVCKCAQPKRKKTKLLTSPFSVGKVSNTHTDGTHTVLIQQCRGLASLSAPILSAS